MSKKIEMTNFTKGENIKINYSDSRSKDLSIYEVLKSKYPKYIESAIDPFSIILKANKEVFFNQGYYEFEYKSIGDVELFMTPILPASGDEDNFYYEIVFS